MNLLLIIGLLLTVGYIAGWLLNQIGLPKIIGYIITGIAFSPSTFDFIGHSFIETTEPIIDICLAFIAFEVGGSLKWSKIREHENEILSITLFASIIPFAFMLVGIFLFGLLFPAKLPFDALTLFVFALILGALASPTAPAATLAVIHQYKAKGKVTDTILGIAALDDVLGILLFSFTTALIFIFSNDASGLIGNPVLNAFYEIIVAILLGIGFGFIIDEIAKFFPITTEGQWVVIIFSLIISCVGISKALHVDILLSSMTMGIVVANTCQRQRLIFRILERYTEELIFLFFFLLSGLHLDISIIPQAALLIFLFVLLRAAGKYAGAYIGARAVSADPSIQKYTAGGLLPQAGIVIGLVLNVYQNEQFSEISEILLTTIMGATVIHELIGPVIAKHSLYKAGELTITK